MNNSFNSLFKALLCGGMMLAANVQCEKMNLSADDADANVTIRIASYEQMPFPAATRAAVGDMCSRLNFVIFNTDGERVDQINQSLGEDGFGVGAFNLPAGTYQLAIVAHSAAGNPTVNKRSGSKNESIAFTNDKGFTDTFFFTQRVEIGDEPVDLPVNLRRVVAKVRFVNDDAIPERADRIRFYYTGGSGSIDALTGYGNVNSQQYAWIEKSRTPLEIYTIPWQESAYLNVTIQAYADDERLTSTDVTAIPIRRNCITTCHGPLFNGKVGKISFTLTLDDAWGTPIDFEVPTH